VLLFPELNDDYLLPFLLQGDGDPPLPSCDRTPKVSFLQTSSPYFRILALRALDQYPEDTRETVPKDAIRAQVLVFRYPKGSHCDNKHYHFELLTVRNCEIS
jgi:hypothetical protein